MQIQRISLRYALSFFQISADYNSKNDGRRDKPFNCRRTVRSPGVYDRGKSGSSGLPLHDPPERPLQQPLAVRVRGTASPTDSQNYFPFFLGAHLRCQPAEARYPSGSSRVKCPRLCRVALRDFARNGATVSSREASSTFLGERRVFRLTYLRLKIKT